MASGGTNSYFGGDGGFCTIAASVLCWYEHIITLGEEVRCVWKKRISAASVLFLLNRYLTLVSSLVSVVLLLPWPSFPEVAGFPYTEEPVEPYNTICWASVRFLDVCLILTTLFYTLFAALRMFALYGLRKSVFTTVFVIGLVNPGVQVFLMTIESITTSLEAFNGVLGPIGSQMPYGRSNCFHNARHLAQTAQIAPAFPALRVHALIFEGILIGLTWRKTRSRWNLQSTTIRTPFTTMLLKYGTMYFVVIAVALMLNVIGVGVFWISDRADITFKNATIPLFLSRASPIVDALTSICMSRFILGLLGIAADQRRTIQWSSFQRKTLPVAGMAETIAGNMGGDLDDGLFADGSGEDLAETEESEDNGSEGDRPRVFGGRDAMC